MKTQSQWLFEAPLAPEATYYLNPYSSPEYYSEPEWEAEWELHEGNYYSFDAMAAKDPNRASSANVQKQIANAKATLKRLQQRTQLARKEVASGKPGANARLGQVLKAVTKVERILQSLKSTKVPKNQQHSYMTPERVQRLQSDIEQRIKGKLPASQPSPSLLAPKYGNPAWWSSIHALALAQVRAGQHTPLQNGGMKVILGPFPDFTGWLRDPNFTLGQEQKVYRLMVVFDSQGKWHHYPVP